MASSGLLKTVDEVIDDGDDFELALKRLLYALFKSYILAVSQVIIIFMISYS